VTAIAVEPYPIVAIKTPWADGTPGIWTNADNPTVHKYHAPWTGPAWNEYQQGNKLVLLKPDGTEEVLLDAGLGGVIDPNVDPAAKWVFYAKATPGKFNGYDIYKMNFATRQEVRLTHQEWTPSRSLNYGATWDEAGKLQGHPPSSISPVVMGSRILFCFNRDCLRQEECFSLGAILSC
jgi:hypothetical protein